MHPSRQETNTGDVVMEIQQRGHIVCFGELLLRMSSPAGEMLLQTPRVKVCIGGAEANVAVSLAHFGHDVALVSTLPANALMASTPPPSASLPDAWACTS
jgi:hypothetical protein